MLPIRRQFKRTLGRTPPGAYPEPGSSSITVSIVVPESWKDTRGAVL